MRSNKNPIFLSPNILNLTRFVFTLVSLAFLSSCQNLSQTNQTAKLISWEEHRQIVSDITIWDLEGKIGITYPYRNKRKAVSASTDWEQKHSTFNINFFGPMGLGHFNIQGQEGYVVLTNPKGRKYKARSPEALFYRHTGMKLPLNDIAYWAKGVPAPDKTFSITKNQENNIEQLEQSDWLIRYESYQAIEITSKRTNSDTEAINMPRKIKMSGDDINVTMIIKTWNI